MSVEAAIGQLDRSQRERLRALAVALHLTSEFGGLFGSVMDAIDAAEAEEAYVGHHMQREVWPDLWQ